MVSDFFSFFYIYEYMYNTYIILAACRTDYPAYPVTPPLRSVLAIPLLPDAQELPTGGRHSGRQQGRAPGVEGLSGVEDAADGRQGREGHRR
jgi:hypothetical protein